MLDFVFSNRFALSCVEKHKPRWVPIGNKKKRGKDLEEREFILTFAPETRTEQL